MLCYILNHAATSSYYFGHIVCWYHYVEWIAGELFTYGLVILIKSLAKLFDSLLDVLQGSLHRADALIRFQDSVVVIFIASHVNAKGMLKIFGEVSMATNNESTGIRIDDKFARKFYIFFIYLFCFYFVPVLN